MKKTILQRFFLSLCLMIVGCLGGAGNSAWAEKLTIDFESATSVYTDWKFTNMTSAQTGAITTHGGTYYGTTGGRTTASIQTKKIIPYPSAITFYISKTSGNTTSSSWKIQVSSDNSKWTDVKTQPASSMDMGSWVEVTQDLSSYKNVYIRVYYKGTTAVRAIDDLSLTYTTTPPTHYTVSWMVNGETYTEGTPSTDVVEGGKVETLPTNPAAIGSNVFMGWRASTISGTLASAPDGLFTTAKDAPVVTGETTYYAVFAKREGCEPTEVLNQTLTYDTWTYYGSTTEKNNYRLFHTDSYIESTEFDLSKLSKVIVYGGTFGGSGNNKLSIGDGTNTWKDVTVRENSETGVNTYTDGTPLTGTGTLRVTSKSGTASSTGVRISKVEIFIMTGGYTYSNYATTIATQPAANIHATTYYKQITSSDELVDGGVYLIVCESKNEAMGVIDNNEGRCLGAAITLNGNTYTGSVNQSDHPYEVTITEGNNGYYNLYHAGGKYITSTSTDFAFAATGDNGWSISFDNSGNALISNKNHQNKADYYIQRNNKYNYYKNYQSGQEAIQLYQKVGVMPIAKATGYVSTYVADFAYVMPKHITGHTVALADKQDVIITEKVFRAGEEVPALTPLLIKSDEDYAAEETSRNYNPAVLNKTVDAYTGENMLEYRRTAENYTNTMKDENVYYYKLAIKDGNVGFYWGATGGAAFIMTKPSTAYLTVPQSISVQGFVLNLEEGETTGIATVVTNEDAPIYNLQGIRMNGKNLPKGIYIQGGKKFMVK